VRFALFVFHLSPPQLEVRIEVVIAPVVNAPWRDRGSLLRRSSALVTVRIIRITLGESWRSEDGAKNDNGKKLFHGSSPG
jgi:hypothetical protein